MFSAFKVNVIRSLIDGSNRINCAVSFFVDLFSRNREIIPQHSYCRGHAEERFFYKISRDCRIERTKYSAIMNNDDGNLTMKM